MSENIIKTPAQYVQVGDLVDLQDCEYISKDHEHYPMIEDYFSEVTEVEQETPECTAISFEGFDQVGFPTNYKLKVVTQD